MRQRSARELAFSVLLDVERENAYSNIGLNKTLNASGADARERAMATRLVYGVLERKLTLDHTCRAYLQKGSRLKPNVRTLLRLGAYEILYLDGVPPRASVNEYVSLAKGTGAGYAAGMINAVLRRVAEHGAVLPPENDPAYLSVKYSVSPALVSVYSELYGDETICFLDSLMKDAPVYGRINTLKTDSEGLNAALCARELEIFPVDGCPELFRFADSAAFAQTEAFRDGMFYIQDLSSACAGRMLEARRGMRILDVCAAPGGKSFYAAISAQGAGEVVSRDIFEHKTRLIAEGAARLGLDNIRTEVADASLTPEKEIFDRVICDVPCSGLGVIRKKPELRYRDISDLAALNGLQYQILGAAAAALKPGGRLVYSTCTVTKYENEDVVRRFLSENPGYHEVRPALPYGEYGEYGVRFSPHKDDCDGFYACAIEKTIN